MKISDHCFLMSKMRIAKVPKSQDCMRIKLANRGKLIKKEPGIYLVLNKCSIPSSSPPPPCAKSIAFLTPKTEISSKNLREVEFNP